MSILKARYSTTSLNVAAWLVALGHEVNVTGPMHQRAFEFDSPTAEADSKRFYQNGLIAARLYAAALSDLKRMVHTVATNPNLNPETPSNVSASPVK